MNFCNFPQLTGELARRPSSTLHKGTMNNSKYSYTFVSYHLQNKAVSSGNHIKQTLAGVPCGPT